VITMMEASPEKPQEQLLGMAPGIYQNEIWGILPAANMLTGGG